MLQHPKKQDDKFKKKRQSFSNNFRKNTRSQIFTKKRYILSGHNKPINQDPNQNRGNLLIVDDRIAEHIQKFFSTPFYIENINELIQNINDSDIIKQHYGLIGIRKLLSIPQNPPIQSVIDAGLVPKLIEYATQDNFPQLQLQSAWALTNIAAGTLNQCQAIIDKGCIPLFINLLRSQNINIIEPSIWAIGNITSDNIYSRDNIIRNGGIIYLVESIQNNLNFDNIVSHGVWVLSNLCRGQPLPQYQFVKDGISLICKIIAQNLLNDQEILADCFWAISYHCSTKTDQIEVIINLNLIPIIVSYLDNNVSLAVPCINILKNISEGSDDQIEQIVKAGGIEELYKLLVHFKKIISKEACLILSNIIGGSKHQLQQILNHPNLIDKLLQLFANDSSGVQKQICYIFANMKYSGDPIEVFNFYKDKNIVQYYINLLNSKDIETIEVSLQCLDTILSIGGQKKKPQNNPLVMQIFKMNAIDQIQQLQYHESDQVYKNVSILLKNFFEIKDPSLWIYDVGFKSALNI